MTAGQRIYRPDIDGLRAVAVLSVMVFHAHDALLPGGFVGVDIFFVISGYLISRQIAANVAAGTFSLLEFYRRRIRRIMPMMLVVVAATLPTSLLIMTPEDGRAVAKSAVWSIASLANIHFWRDLDQSYFAQSSAELPLLHLWSLGVEEQFYLLWPLLLTLAVRKLRPIAVITLAIVATIASFQLASAIFPAQPTFAYYMLPTRMGELLLGALIAIPAALRPWQLTHRAASMAAAVGAVLVAMSLVVLNRYQPFPGWLALPPTLGAALLILAGEGRSNPLRYLAIAPLTFIGRISYSAYLWHWPLFALYRYAYGEPGFAACSTILLLTIGLSWASYVWVEQPTRHSRLPFLPLALRQFVVPAVVLLLPAMLVIYAARVGLPTASAGYLAQLATLRQHTRPSYSFDWVCQRRRLSERDVRDARCVLGADGTAQPRVVIWGDSNASHYVAMVDKIAEHAGVRVRNFAVDACPPLLTDPRPYVDARRVSDCLSSAAVVRAELDRYPVAVISAAWTLYQARAPSFLDDLAGLIRERTNRGQRIILLSKAPILRKFDPRCAEKALRVPFLTCSNAPEMLDAEVVRINADLRALAARTPNTYFFDANDYLCPAGRCPVTTASGELRYLDSTHLTVAGSIELGLAILANERIPAAFSALTP
ncbi:MAG: acyltransferase family protein [Steroidobacteraceae bacterium]